MIGAPSACATNASAITANSKPQPDLVRRLAQTRCNAITWRLSDTRSPPRTPSAGVSPARPAAGQASWLARRISQPPPWMPRRLTPGLGFRSTSARASSGSDHSFAQWIATPSPSSCAPMRSRSAKYASEVPSSPSRSAIASLKDSRSCSRRPSIRLPAVVRASRHTRCCGDSGSSNFSRLRLAFANSVRPSLVSLQTTNPHVLPGATKPAT